MELFDYADSHLGTQISFEHPTINGYEATNLLDKTNALSNQQLLLPTQGGFLAESFIKPPVELTITLPHQISLAAIVINPRIRLHTARAISLFIMNSRGCKWEFIGKLEWTGSRAMGLYNQELNTRAIEQHTQAKGSAVRDVGSWLPISRPLHFVTQIKVRILAMQQSVALGMGGLEIWAQPSQRLPRHLKERAWLEIRQHSRISQAPHNAQFNTSFAEPAETNCPPEFIDSITQNIMSDPVILPSQNICDRSTIVRHLAERATDPFTGLPLAIEQVKPNLALQLRIRNWQQK